MIVKRTLAILAAVLLVVAVALATVGARVATLGQALGMWDRECVARLNVWVETHLGLWTWTEVIMPVLARPVWLAPVALAVLCAGFSVSLKLPKTTSRSQRRS